MPGSYGVALIGECGVAFVGLIIAAAISAPSRIDLVESGILCLH